VTEELKSASTAEVAAADVAADEPVADVVAYVHGTVGYAWCGWCRQWHRHGSAWRLPAVRPSGCSPKRNEFCPTRGDKLVMVWPVVVRWVPNCTGDGRLGGKLPVSDKVADNVVTVVPARTAAPDEIPKALARLMDATPEGCTSRAQYARYTVAERTGRIADVVLMRHDCKSGEVLRVCYVDGKFGSAESNKRGRIAGNKVRQVIIECEADA